MVYLLLIDVPTVCHRVPRIVGHWGHGRGPVVHLGNVCQVPARFPRAGCAPWRGTALRVLSSILGTIPWHTGCTLKVPYGAVSGIPNLIFGGVIGDTEDFEVLFGLDDLVVRVGRIGVYHWIEPVTLCPFGGNLHGQFKGIGCTLFGIVQGCGADPEFRCWG